MKEELEKLSKIKAKAIPLIIGAFETVIPKTKKMASANFTNNISLCPEERTIVSN